MGQLEKILERIATALELQNEQTAARYASLNETDAKHLAFRQREWDREENEREKHREFEERVENKWRAEVERLQKEVDELSVIGQAMAAVVKAVRP